MTASLSQRRTRVGVLTFVLAGFFVLAGIRLVAIVLIDGPRLSEIARSEHNTVVALAAVRGPIVDREGRPLALSAETRSIYARPRPLLESSTAAERSRLAALLGMSSSELAERLGHPAPFVWLARHLPVGRARAVEGLGLEGVGAISEYKRFYPEGDLAGAVVGLAGMDGQGLSGLELQYNSLVRGQPLELHVYHDAFGRRILDSPMALRDAEPGARLELTLDSSIQAAAEHYLSAEIARSGARHGTAIVLDPFSGAVIALANVDPSASPERARTHDAAVQDAFEPGSTMKGILGAIALDDHVVAPNQQIFCENGAWRLAGHTIHDDSPHGWLSLGGIVEVSSNIGAAKIALLLGARRFSAGLARFGVGHRTGIDLPGEASGILRPASSWRTLELADHGFGQGLAVTPMQLAVAYAAIANGGVLMRPYLVSNAYDAEGEQILQRKPEALGRAITPATAHEINQLLRGVVNGADGTAHLARVADFTVAGKTGTAQMVNPATGGYYPDRLVASFVGFLPADDPRLVILVVLYDVAHGHFGGLYAAPAFSQIAAAAVQRLDLLPAKMPPAYETASLLPLSDGAAIQTTAASPVNDNYSAANGTDPADTLPPYMDGSSSAITTGRTPDFLGTSLREAFAIARARQLTITASGAGYVIAQVPAPGHRRDGRPVNLTLALERRPMPVAAGLRLELSASSRKRVR